MPVPVPPQRTRVSNGRLALLIGVGVALVGLAPVAHMFLSPTSKVQQMSALLAVLVLQQEARSAGCACSARPHTHALAPLLLLLGADAGFVVGGTTHTHRWMAASTCQHRRPCGGPT